MQTDLQPRSRAPRAFIITFLAATACYVGLAAYSVHPRLPYNELQLPGEGSPLSPHPFPLQMVMPQGWKFFTKSPRDPELVILERGSDRQWKPVVDGTISDTGGRLNFDRTSRSVGVEMAMLIHHAKKADWSRECRDTDAKCLGLESKAVTVNNTMPHARLCGEVGFVSRAPVPFAWRDSLTAPMPANVLVMRVQCKS